MSISEREPKFEIYKDASGKFRFRLKAPNGEIIAVGEPYTTKNACKNGIASVKENAPKAEIVPINKAWKKRPSKPFRKRRGEE